MRIGLAIERSFVNPISLTGHTINIKGKITVGTKLRSAVSKIYFEDRIAPVSKAEYELAHADHSPAIEESAKRKPKQLKKKL